MFIGLSQRGGVTVRGDVGKDSDDREPTRLKTLHRRGDLTTDNGGRVTWENIKKDERDAVAVTSSHPNSKTVSATFTFDDDDLFSGVWEYPWNGTITNTNRSYADIGVYGEQPGINWANARAPFFFSKSGFAVYVDTPIYGTFGFQPGRVEVAFNTSILNYTVMFNPNLTELISQYTTLSSKPSMPPDSAYGPIFWSDNSNEDFHAGVTNAEENFYDIVNHLYYNQIRATGMFADSKK